MISTFSSNWFEGIRKEIHFINNEFVEKIFVKNSNKCKMIFGKNENEEKEEKKYLNFLRRNLCPFFNLCSAMISSSLNEIQFENLIKFQLKDVIFQTNLHLSDFDGLSIEFQIGNWIFCFSLLSIWRKSNVTLSSVVWRLFRIFSNNSSTNSKFIRWTMEIFLRFRHIDSRSSTISTKFKRRKVRSIDRSIFDFVFCYLVWRIRVRNVVKIFIDV